VFCYVVLCVVRVLYLHTQHFRDLFTRCAMSCCCSVVVVLLCVLDFIMHFGYCVVVCCCVGYVGVVLACQSVSQSINQSINQINQAITNQSIN